MQSTRFKRPYSNLHAVSRPLELLNEALTRRSRKRKASIKKTKGSIKKKKKMSIDASSVLDDEDVEESDEEDSKGLKLQPCMTRQVVSSRINYKNVEPHD